MGIPSIASAQDAWKNGDGQKVVFNESFRTSLNAALQTISGWATSLLPRVGGASGGFPTKDGAPRVCTSATTGSIVVQAPKTSKSLYLVGIEATLRSGPLGTLYILDRFADIYITEGAAAMGSGALDATSKLSATDFCHLIIETGPTGTSDTFPSYTPTIQYTNEGNVAHTSALLDNVLGTNLNTLLQSRDSGANGTIPLFFPQAGGDQGMRTVTSMTIAGAVSPGPAGDLVLVLVQQVASIPLNTIGVPLGRDMLAQFTPALLRNDPCLFCVYVPLTGAANTIVAGELRIISM